MSKQTENMINENLYNEISVLIQKSRKKVVQSVNWTMVITYLEIGKRIVEEEQHGKNRAEYGKFLIANLSEKLSDEFGKGFDKRNLFYIRVLQRSGLCLIKTNSYDETAFRVNHLILL